MIELRFLIWLRLRQWRQRLVHALRLFGYNPNDRSLKEFFYNLYLLAFFFLWIVAGTWGPILNQAAQIGASLSPRLWERLWRGLPWVLFLAVVGLSLRYARRTPLSLSFPDVAYLAGSPMPRRALTLVQFGQTAGQFMLALLPAAALTAVILAQPVSATIGPWAAVRAVAAAIPLLLLALAMAWLWGIARLSIPQLSHWRGYGWMPLALLVPAVVWPQAGLWPGQLWLDALMGTWTAGGMTLLGLIDGLLLVALMGMSERLDLIAVADESAVYARVRVADSWARLSPKLAPALRAMRRQNQLAGRRPFLHLPTASGAATLLFKSGLTLLRQGASLFALAVWGAVFTGVAQWIVSSAAPVELWIYWLLALLVFPPRQLAATLRADLRAPFLRQFLPLSHWRLFVMDTAVPLLFLLIGSLGVWLAQPVLSPALIIFVGILLVLCQGVSLLPITSRRIRIPASTSMAVTMGGVAAAGVWRGGLAAFVMAVTAVLILSAAVIRS